VQPQRFLPWGSLPASAVPRAWAERLADAAGDVAHHHALDARGAVTRNLTAILGATPTVATVRGVFRTYARYYLGMMRLRHRTAGAAIGPMTWENAGSLKASVARGRGVLVLSAHLGNWDLVGVALAARFGAITIFVEPLTPASVAGFYTQARARHGVRIAPVGTPGRAPVETLRAGGIVALAADRAFGKRLIQVQCGAGQIEIPTGGIALALRTGAAIHPMFALRTAVGWRLLCGGDLAADLPAAAAAANAARVARRFATALRAAVQQHPDQWCALQPMVQPARVRGAA